jgi:hypothetical protein
MARQVLVIPALIRFVSPLLHTIRLKRRGFPALSCQDQTMSTQLLENQFAICVNMRFDALQNACLITFAVAIELRLVSFTFQKMQRGAE